MLAAKPRAEPARSQAAIGCFARGLWRDANWISSRLEDNRSST
jgi:hypothetical protein